jgi:diguanylate cyclase (GGDEF)-like protein
MKGEERFMGTEKVMVRLRWFALGSMLLFLAVIKFEYLRVLLFLIAAGVLYNFALTVIPPRILDIERLRAVTAFFDGVGIFAAVALTGGLDSLLFVYLAAYAFTMTMRFSLTVGATTASLISIALSSFYFIRPTSTNVSLLVTRIVILFLVSLSAGFLEIRRGFLREIVSEEAAREMEPQELKRATTEVVGEEVPPRVVERVEEGGISKKEIFEGEVAEDIPAKILEELPPKPIEMKAPKTTDLKGKLTELAILHEASKAIGASLILEDVLGTVVDIAIRGVTADIAGALIFNEKTKLLTIGALRGFGGDDKEIIESSTFSSVEGIIGNVYMQKRTVIVEDISSDETYKLPFDGRIKSFLATPLATDGYKLGVLFLGKFIKEPFSQDSIEFIETIAGQAAIAIENAKLFGKAQELAIHDGLTGIYNYRYFMRQLQEEIKRAERYHRSVSLLMVDIDLFKRINDAFGHRRGDEVLKGVAVTLVNNTRETDIVARYGGEEFAVILPETSLESAMEAATKLRSAVAKGEYAKEKGKVIKLTASLGVATYPTTASNQEELLRQADDALYSAKSKRNAICNPHTCYFTFP